MYAKSKRLTVLHVATINKAISSELGYGPIETVIYNIDKGLHALGHRSIVACSADSEVVGELFPTVLRSLGDYMRECNAAGQGQVDRHLSLALARARMGDIDVVHMHEWFERVYTGSFNPPVPIVMTLHVPGHFSGITAFREAHPATIARPLHSIAISDYQRRQYDDLFVPVTTTVLHGIDVDECPFGIEPHPEKYLFNIGRITAVKGQDTAIAVARQCGAKLILAGCVQDKKDDRAFFSGLKNSLDLIVDVGRHPVGDDYFEKVMKPILCSDKQIIYIGELDSAAKKHWYRHAEATLFPVRWGEPFGMVLVESMAAGTPIVAFREGAVPEIVADGKTGFVVDSVEAMVTAVGRIARIDRAECRAHVERYFSIRKMAEGYEAVYEKLVHVPAFNAPRAGQQLTL